VILSRVIHQLFSKQYIIYYLEHLNALLIILLMLYRNVVDHLKM